jgi:hypothetical protein
MALFEAETLVAETFVAFRTGDLVTPCSPPEGGTVMKSFRKPLKEESFFEDLCGNGGASISSELDRVKEIFGWCSSPEGSK